VKFLHTADWQIGMKATSLGEAGARAREERLAALVRVIETGKHHATDFILVAGDLFEDNAVDRVLVQKVADILTACESKVFIIPGNHDPLVPGSVWEHPAWKSAGNLHVLRDESPVPLSGGVIFPCPVREKHSGRNPTLWIPSEPSGQIRIGMAHGTVEGIRQDEPDYPIPRDAAHRAELDYLALGHWHSHTTYPSPEGAIHMAYSGTHETTKFGERDSGNVIVVEIRDAGASPTIIPVRTGGLEWITLHKELRERGDLESTRETLESIADSRKTIIEVALSGLLMADDRPALDHIEQILSSRFLWGKLDASEVRPSPEDETWITNLPPGIICDAAI